MTKNHSSFRQSRNNNQLNVNYLSEYSDKLQREKNLTNLQNLYDEILKEKESFHSLKPQLLNDILLLILNNRINPDIQKKIILFYIDLFFLQKFSPESIDKIQIQTLLNNIFCAINH